MLKKLKLKTKLLLPLSVLILIVLVLSISIISTQYTKSKFLLELGNNINLATKISQFVHSTQKERGMTSGYLASNGVKFKKELIKQRAITDMKVRVLSKYLTTIQNQRILKAIKKNLIAIEKLYVLRNKVDLFEINAQESIDFYSKMNDNFLSIIIEISTISQLPIITQNILAYVNFLYAKENVGIERAVGTAILTTDKKSPNLKITFINLISIEDSYTNIFFKYASKKAKATYKDHYKGKDIDIVDKIRDIILYTDPINGYGIKPEYWFKNITSKINKLKLIDDYLEQEILHNIDKELSTTNKLFNNLFLLNILSILVFLLIVNMIVKLISSEKRLKKLIDKYIISSTTDTRGIILEASDAFCDISGYTKEELIGKPHNIVRHPDMPRSSFKNLWSILKSGKVWNGEIKNLKKDGGYYWVYAHVEPLFDKKGNIEGYVAIRIDITDSIHLEEELIRSKEKDKTLFHQSKLAQMGEMMSMIAHQWRQPLSAISATSSDMRMKIMLDKYDKEYFTNKLVSINNFSQHLSSTINDFRNFYSEDKIMTDVLHSEMAKGAFEIVAPSLEYKNIKLESNFNCKKRIRVLANELRQVVLNLIKNSEDILVEKSIENPYIIVKTYDDEAYSYLEISDNGGGIPEEFIDRIFDPYFSTKTKKDGTGLGLYMSKTIVEDHCQGDLLINNTEDGVKFTIKIPIIKEEG